MMIIHLMIKKLLNTQLFKKQKTTGQGLRTRTVARLCEYIKPRTAAETVCKVNRVAAGLSGYQEVRSFYKPLLNS